MTKKNQYRQLTEHEAACARRLQEIFSSRKKTKGITQAKLAEQMGISQSGVGQYINGSIPLNLQAIIMFSIHLECKVQDIDPECPVLLSVTPEEQALLSAYWEMETAGNQAGKQALLQVAALSPAFRATLEQTQEKQSAALNPSTDKQ